MSNDPIQSTTVQQAVEYREIPGFSGYRVGSDGSLWRFRTDLFVPKWKKLKPTPDARTGGHLRVSLYIGSTRYNRKIHRLVLEAFVGSCPPGMEACHHPDPNPANNNISNLRWDTRQANMDDRTKHGHTARGERSGLAKMTAEKILQIRELASKGVTNRELGPMFHVHHTTISDITSGRTWRHVQ